MAENTGTSHLRYLDAGHVADDRIDFDGLDVRNARGDTIGTADGFIVRRDSNRPYYLVVDSGGWFSSRHYLVPIGHVRLDPDDRALRVDIDRDTIQGFPEVQVNRFDELSESEARRIDERTLRALAPNEVAVREGDTWDYDRLSHYRQPDWWQARPASELPPPPLTNRPLAEDYDPAVVHTPGGVEERADLSGRAQPGDVLGIETGGETTSIGDTARDEDRRREDAEETNREILRDQRKDERR